MHASLHLGSVFLTFYKMSNGMARIEIDTAYVRKHGYDDLFDEFVVKQVSDDDSSPAFFDGIAKFLVSMFTGVMLYCFQL